MYQWKDLRLDPDTCEVSYRGKILRLYPKEYELLKLFFDFPMRVLSPSLIIEHLWSFDSTPTESVIRTHIKGLRHKLKDAGVEDDIIQTVHGLGYRLKPLPKEIKKSEMILTPMIMKLLALHFSEYAIVNQELVILAISANVKNFSDYPLDVKIGGKITIAFPELIGSEFLLLEILENRRSSLDIKGIARVRNSFRPDYINIFAIPEPTEEQTNQRLLFLFEDASENMTLKQQVVQRENESYLKSCFPKLIK